MSPRTEGEVRHRGRTASRGLAAGPLAVHRAEVRRTRAAGAPATEEKALEDSIARAAADLGELIGGADEAAAEILDFQIALLEDDELTAPALADIRAGRPADDAWRTALDAQIAEYDAAEAEYFRARGSDLRDLRDRVLRNLTGQSGGAADGPEAGAPAIYVGGDLTPSRFLEVDWSRHAGAALTGGSASSHAAMLARARGIPLVVGIDADLDVLSSGTAAILDAEEGWLLLDPEEETRARFGARMDRAATAAARAAVHLAGPAETAAGERVAVRLNVDDPAALSGVDPAHCDGIGLARTEFLFVRGGGGPLPDEDAQFEAYAALVRWAAGRPVNIRTLDAGGDKPIPGYTPDGERNPFLGMRGLRLSLAHPDVFGCQLRALARAAALGPVEVMCPMVTRPEEMDQARALLDDAVGALEREGTACRRPRLGMMVEVPSAALRAGEFAVDFYSIGSNDLVQYVTATARDDAAVAELHDPADPAVLELVRRTVDAGRELGRDVGLCGDAAAMPERIPDLLAAGLRSLSVPPTALARTKAAIAGWR